MRLSGSVETVSFINYIVSNFFLRSSYMEDRLLSPDVNTLFPPLVFSCAVEGFLRNPVKYLRYFVGEIGVSAPYEALLSGPITG